MQFHAKVVVMNDKKLHQDHLFGFGADGFKNSVESAAGIVAT